MYSTLFVLLSAPLFVLLLLLTPSLSGLCRQRQQAGGQVESAGVAESNWDPIQTRLNIPAGLSSVDGYSFDVSNPRVTLKP